MDPSEYLLPKIDDNLTIKLRIVLTYLDMNILQILPVELLCLILKFLYHIPHWIALEKTNRALRKLIIEECWEKRIYQLRFDISINTRSLRRDPTYPALSVKLFGNCFYHYSHHRQLHSLEGFLGFWKKCKKVDHISIVGEVSGIMRSLTKPEASQFSDPGTWSGKHNILPYEPPSEILYIQMLNYMEKAQLSHPKALVRLSVSTNEFNYPDDVWLPILHCLTIPSRSSLKTFHLDDTGSQLKHLIPIIKSLINLQSLTFNFRLRDIKNNEYLTLCSAFTHNQMTLIIDALHDKELTKLNLTWESRKNGFNLKDVRRLLDNLKPQSKFKLNLLSSPCLLSIITNTHTPLSSFQSIEFPENSLFYKLEYLYVGTSLSVQTKYLDLFRILPNLTTLDGLYMDDDMFYFTREDSPNPLLKKVINIIALPVNGSFTQYSYDILLKQAHELKTKPWYKNDSCMNIDIRSSKSVKISFTHSNGIIHLLVPEI